MLYYAANPLQQDGWNEYAQQQADEHNDAVGVDHCTDVLYRWRPPLTFGQWSSEIDAPIQRGLCGD